MLRPGKEGTPQAGCGAGVNFQMPEDTADWKRLAVKTVGEAGTGGE